MSSRRALYRILLVSVVLIVPLLIFFAPTATAGGIGLMVALSPIWLPLVLAAILVPFWLTYVQSQYVASVPHTVLELKPGEQTPRTARAMELIFYSLYHRVEITRIMALVVGRVRLPWSFEIVAHKGTVRFFMRIPTAHRSAVEARVRAEYRDIDIDEVQDYARTIPYNPINMHLESREFDFTKPDPYPIETYEAWEADSKVENPFMTLLERLVTVGKDEHLCVSFMVRPHQRDRQKIWEQPTDTLHTDAQREIEELVGSEGRIHGLPEAKRELVDAIEGALKKPSFDCGIRAIYVAKRGAEQQHNIELLDSLFMGFESPNRNGFVAYDARESLSWPLSDIAAAIPGFSDWHMFNLYRRRAFFAPPYFGKPFILNTAELATLFHLPYITRASALAGSRGKKLEPPENLPVVA